MNNYDVTLNYTFRHTNSSEAIKEYASKKITPLLKKFIHHSTDGHLIFQVEKARQIVELNFQTDGHHFTVKEESEDMYKSIDALVESARHQLQKNKEKITEHHR